MQALHDDVDALWYFGPAAGVAQAHAASAGNPKSTWARSRRQDWFSCFDAIVTADDPEVFAAKPAPDLYRVAVQRLDADPAQTLAFEDSPFGVQAAVAAGLRVIAVPDPAMDRSKYAAVTAILSDLRAFEPAEWGLLGEATRG